MTPRPHLRVAYRADDATRERERQAHMHLAAAAAQPRKSDRVDGWHLGHRAGYTQGWHYGAFCGAVAGVLCTGMALWTIATIGREWPWVVALLGSL